MLLLPEFLWSSPEDDLPLMVAKLFPESGQKLPESTLSSGFLLLAVTRIFLGLAAPTIFDLLKILEKALAAGENWHFDYR